MSPVFCRLLRAAALATGMLSALTAGAQTLPAPGIAPAQHFRFTPQPGTAWYLDNSADGLTWIEVAGPFFARADGGPVDHLQAGAPAARHRLRYVDPATIGPAPAMVSGFSALMENHGEPAAPTMSPSG